MAPSSKRLQIQSEAKAHLLPGHHRDKMCFMELKETLRGDSTGSTY